MRGEVVELAPPATVAASELERGLAARGQASHGTRAALHPRWAAALCVAPRTNSAVAIGPSSRLASGALRRSRCSREIIHGLLGEVVAAVQSMVA